MNYSSDGEITDLIIDYVNEEIYDYAVMIDGPWGSGKTYFINDKIIPEIEKLKYHNNSQKCRKVVYVSLYGIKDADELSNLLYLKLIEKHLGKGAKLLPIIGSAGSIVGNVIKQKLGMESVVETPGIKKFLDEFIDWKYYVYIFDDLERCAIPYNLVLGYINSLVEQNHIKVIIVANQEEIEKVSQKNIELKYYLSLHDEIDFSPLNHENHQNPYQGLNPHNNTNKKLTLEDLKKRALYLFDNRLYCRIKEKLIGQTIYYYPSLSSVLPSILKQCHLNQRTKTFLSEKIAIIEGTYSKENYNNLRTLQFSISFFNKIFNSVYQKLNRYSEFDQALQDVLGAILTVSIRFKQGEKNYQWMETSEYGFVNTGDKSNLSHYFLSFKFIHDYIYLSIYDAARVQLVLENYIIKLQCQNAKYTDPTDILSNYWELEDDQIKSEVKKLIDNIKSGKYAPDSYIWILSLVYQLKDLGFNTIPIDDIYSFMLQNINSNVNSIQTYQEPVLPKDSPLFNEFRQHVEGLKNEERKTKYQQNILDINSYFSTENGWGKNFINLDRNKLINQKGFLVYVDVQSCMQCLNNSSVKDFSDFRRAVFSIYDFENIKDFFLEDLDNLKLLKTKLEDAKYAAKIKEFNRTQLVKDLSDIITQLST